MWETWENLGVGDVYSVSGHQRRFYKGLFSQQILEFFEIFGIIF